MDGASGSSNWTGVGDQDTGGGLLPTSPFAAVSSSGSGGGSDPLSTSTTSTPSPYWYHAGGRVLYTTSTLTPEAARAQYYAAYDPMTGLRIAATLGAIITLFTLFLIYKSKCRPAKSNQPQEGV